MKNVKSLVAPLRDNDRFSISALRIKVCLSLTIEGLSDSKARRHNLVTTLVEQT